MWFRGGRITSAKGMTRHASANAFPGWLKAVLALAVLCIVVVGVWIHRGQERHLRAGVESELEAVTELKSTQIVEWRRERLLDAELVRGTLRFGGPEMRVPVDPPSGQARQRLAEWLKQLVDGVTYRRAFLVDCGLNVRSAVPFSPDETAPSLSAALRGAVEEAFRTGEALLSEMYRTEESGPVRIAVVIPLEARREAGNDPVPALDEDRGMGALILEGHVGDYLYPLIGFWETRMATAETLLVRRDGDSALFLSDARFMTNTALNLRVPLTDTNRPAIMAALGRQGLTRGVDYRGQQVVAMLKAVPGSSWLLVCKVDEAEVLAAWRHRSILILALMLGAVMLAVGGAAFVWQRRSRDYFKKLHETETALRSSQERYRDLIETAAEGIWSGDAGLRTTFVNKRLEELMGRPSSELLGVPLPEFLHPDDARAVASLAVLRPGQVHRVECRLIPADGEPRWALVSLAARAVSQGRLPDVFATMTDITDIKTAETQLSRQAALLDAANEAITVRTLDHKVTYWNGGAERIYGYSRAEAMGRDIRELGRPNHEAFAAAFAELQKNGRWSGELTSHNKNGHEVFMFCRWTLLRDGQGRPEAMLAINTDVTEKKQLEARFLRAQRMETLGALAGGIAHDLNNILAPILMSSSLLKETTRDPESRAMLESVETCVRRGADMIKQLLIFARGKPSVRVPLPIRQLLRETHTLVTETFPRRIQADITAPGELWSVTGDATQIHQAIMNLCVNARDAMPQGGTLTLAAQNAVVDEVFAAVLPDASPGDYVCLSVSDTGTGIAPAHMERIFDPFFSTKEPGKGTGLGLGTVLGIVRGHGGFVRVDSRVGRGSTFELYLPASHESKAGAQDTVLLESPPARGRNQLILVVDDEAAVRRAVQDTLTRHGYRALTAEHGEEALSLFMQHRAEVRAVVTDMMMPVMDGPELTRRLRQLDERLPILGMSGLTDRAELQRFESLSLGVMLAKPFPGAKLLATLHAALAAAQTPAEAGPISSATGS